MYLLKHLPPHLQKRWTDQLALQHDVDIKRLWRRSPQTMDTVVGNPPLDLNMTFPEEQFSSSSGAGSGSGSDPSSSSSSDPSTSSEPACVRVTMSGFEGECEDLNGEWDLSEDPPGFNFRLFSYTDSDISIVVRDGVYGWELWTTTPVSSYWDDALVPGSIVHFTHADGGCSEGTITLDPFGCGSSSSGSASSGGGSSGGGSSSGAGSSSDPGSGSGSGSSSDPSSSGGGGSGSAPDDSSSSFGSAGYSWEGSASSGGDQDSGRGSTFPSDPDCYSIECARWAWQGSGWRRTVWNFLACPVACRGDCSERPQQSGYPGLLARVACDGTITYYE